MLIDFLAFIVYFFKKRDYEMMEKIGKFLFLSKIYRISSEINIVETPPL